MQELAHTNVKQNRAIKSLVHDMVLENLIVERLRSSLGRRHGSQSWSFGSGIEDEGLRADQRGSEEEARDGIGVVD